MVRRPGSGRGRGSRELWPELERGEPGLLYGVFGEEDFLVQQVVARFEASPAFADNPSLNIERFHAEQTTPARVLESALTMPFLGRRRLVICLETHLFKAAQLAQFLDYLERPAVSTCLVFAGAKLDRRGKFAKRLEKHGKVQIIKKLYPQQLPAWLASRARLREKRLDPKAAAQLAELAGLGLGALDSEIEKLSLYVGRRETIGLEDVQAVTGGGRLYSIFDFTDALAAGRLDRALSAWDQLYALGEPAVRVVAMITRLWRQLLQVRRLLDQGGGEGQVQRALRIPPAATRTLLQRARRERAESLSESLARVLEADVALKSSPGSDRVIMERLIMDLCR